VEKAHWSDEQACPAGSCSMARDWTFDSAAYAPGDYTIRIEASDQMADRGPDHTVARTLPVHVFVDADPPAISFSGPAYEFRQITDDPENMDLGDATYALHAAAEDGADDGNPAHAGSGVKTVDLYLDGAQPDPARMHAEQSCNQGNCPLAIDWDLDAHGLAVGDHLVKLVATDQKGNTSDSSFTLTRGEDTETPPRDAVIESSGPDDPPPDDAEPAAQRSSATAASSPDTSPDAAPSAAPAYYVPNTSRRQAFATGCSAGRANRHGGVILAFGGPSGSSHTKLISGRVITLDAAVNVAAQYGLGYRHCLPEHSERAINVIMGENNSTDGKTGSGNVNSASGAGLANAVDALAQYYKGHSLTDHVGAAGGMDFEPNFGPVGSGRDWAGGFSANTHHPLYNFGSADGCPPSASRSGRRGGQCDNGWKQGDIYFVSWKHNRYPFPEIYVQPQVPQWPAISLFGAQSGQGKMFFPGPVAEHARATSEFKPSTAWSKLFQALRRNPKTSQDHMNYSTDFQRDQVWGH
jgi:hypothetical protein